jgi:hypothetical protein
MRRWLDANPPILKNGQPQRQTFGIIGSYCGDGRHHNRKIISQLREHAAMELYDPEYLDNLRRSADCLKEFNILLCHWIKAFNTTPAGGNFSLDAAGYVQTIYADPNTMLVRMYLGQHEATECLAYARGKRIERPEGLVRTLTMLSEESVPNPVDIYGFDVRTDCSQVSGYLRLGRYVPSSREIIVLSRNGSFAEAH